jgi:hypothetical protein
MLILCIAMIASTAVFTVRRQSIRLQSMNKADRSSGCSHDMGAFETVALFGRRSGYLIEDLLHSRSMLRLPTGISQKRHNSRHSSYDVLSSGETNFISNLEIVSA